MDVAALVGKLPFSFSSMTVAAHSLENLARRGLNVK